MSESLAIVCFQWNVGFREYRPEYVNALARGYRRNLSLPHRFVCITDETEGFSSDVIVMPLPESAREVSQWPSPHGPEYPASYRRLWTFSIEAKALADVVLMTDIDCVVTGPVDPLIEYLGETGADFVGWNPPTTWSGVRRRLAGGNWLLRTGTKAHVWEGLNSEGLAEARKSGQMGSDQAWISYCLANDCVVWPKGHGIFEAQWMRPNKFRVLPEGARIVHFNGADLKPWQALDIEWVRTHWDA